MSRGTAKIRIGLMGIALALLAVVLWRWHGDHRRAPKSASAASTSASDGTARVATAGRAHPDPKTLARGTLAGTVTDEAGAPIAQAQVCAQGQSHELDGELLRAPTCVTTDAHGAFALTGLYPARYTISASARSFQPAVHHPGGDRRKHEVVLAAGERKQGIDVTLAAGGVEVTGTVADLTGGPIANARVSASGDAWRAERAAAITESAADGTFSLWVSPGMANLLATADGYADAGDWVRAPGKVELLLTPESSLAGIVVDAASGAPIEGARVRVSDNDWSWRGGGTTFTDAQGAFRIARLTPGRFVAIARTERGYGRVEGSTLVGLGEHVDGVIVKLFPAVRLEGKVIVAGAKQPCPEPEVSLKDPDTQRELAMRAEPDGSVWAEGVLPGAYAVEVECRGYQARETYDAVVVADQPVSGLVWEVDAGATIRGRVLTSTGAAVERAEVWARSTGGAARARMRYGGDRSARDGSYEVAGLAPGTYKLQVVSDHGVAPADGYTVEVAAGSTIERDLVLDGAGVVRGVVVDAAGAPVAGINVQARPLAGRQAFWSGAHETDDAGAFAIEALRPGDYRIVAHRGWDDELRKPGTTDDAKQGERITVRANQVATVRLVVESQTGVIRGAVIDAAGKPVADAFISAARESDAAGARASSVQQTRWTWDERPVITEVDGTFTLSKLSPGAYTVRAYRKGGGEAIAEHVAVGTTAKLQIRATGSIAGTVRRGDGVPDELKVYVSSAATGFHREESFFRTDGRFVIREVPGGHYRITAEAAGGQKQVELELGEGEQRTGVAIMLDALVTLAGRLVEYGTTTPVPAMRMLAMPARGGTSFTVANSPDESITDAAGRFAIKNAPVGKLRILGFSNGAESDYLMATAVRTVEGTGTIELGDLSVFRRRVKLGEPVGELGVKFAEQPPGIEPEQAENKVSWIDLAGPAARTELKVGDVVTSVDGIDVTGVNADAARGLLWAPPGTKLTLGLARGATVSVVLAAP